MPRFCTAKHPSCLVGSITRKEKSQIQSKALFHYHLSQHFILPQRGRESLAGLENVVLKVSFLSSKQEEPSPLEGVQNGREEARSLPQVEKGYHTKDAGDRVQLGQTLNLPVNKPPQLIMWALIYILTTLPLWAKTQELYREGRCVLSPFSHTQK